MQQRSNLNLSPVIYVINNPIIFSAISCGSVPSVQYASFYVPDSLYNSTIAFTCLTGYHIHGSTVKTHSICQENGTWSPVEQCKRKFTLIWTPFQLNITTNNKTEHIPKFS